MRVCDWIGWSRWYSTALIGVVAVLVGAQQAAAAACPGTWSATSTTLTQDYVKASGAGDCFVLTGVVGAGVVHFDLNGHTITCSGPSACTGAAIKRSTTSTVYVKDFAAANTGGIIGPWATGVRNAWVTSLNIVGPTYGVWNDSCGSTCRVEYNVITNSYSRAIYATSPHGAIQHNFIDGAGDFGIDTSGAGAAIEIHHNYVRNYAIWGMYVADNVNAYSNIIDQPVPVNLPVQSVSGSKPANWSTNNECESSTFCPDPVARYIMP